MKDVSFSLNNVFGKKHNTSRYYKKMNCEMFSLVTRQLTLKVVVEHLKTSKLYM